MPFRLLIARLLGFAWVGFVLYWVVSAFFASRAAKRQSPASRALTLLFGAIPFFLLFTGDHLWGPLTRRFVPDTRAVAVAGVALTYAGLGLAVWARVIIGRNWSAAVTIKHGHRLVSTGPYSVVRHPIYSGLLVGLLGTALDLGETRGLVAVALAFVIWLVKSRTEERFMIERFGEEYENYRRRTHALVPFIF
jgi:protein-S-isoprenylcysteine O-methyltransferase Ste14